MGTEWGPIDDDDDLVGVTSARLLAAGAPRRDRLDALGLLGLLIDHADAEGQVRLPFATLMGEFGVDADRAGMLLAALVDVEVVRSARDPLVVAGRPRAHAGAFRLSAYLANVSYVVNADPASATGPVAPYLVPAPAGADRHRRRVGGPVLARVGAAAAAAVVVLWATAAPSGEPTALRSFADSSSPSGRAPWATTPSQSAASPPEVPDSDQLSSPPPQGTDAADPIGSAASDRSAAAGPSTAPGGPVGAARPGTIDRTGTAPRSPAPRPPGPGPRSRPDVLPAPGGTPGPTPRPDDGGNGCPVGAPEAVVVEHALVPAVARDLLDSVDSATTVEVRGIMRNPSGADLVVRSFEVVVVEGEMAVRVTGSPVPLAVPAGGTVVWRVVLPSGTAPPETAMVEVDILDWTWTDPVYASLCPR